jgi:hypothetical protein
LSKQECREKFLDDGSNAGKGRRLVGTSAHPLSLEKGVRDGVDDDVMLPPRVRAAFEMV